MLIHTIQANPPNRLTFRPHRFDPRTYLTHVTPRHGGLPFSTSPARHMSVPTLGDLSHGTLPPGRARVSSDSVAAPGPGNHTQLGGISLRSTMLGSCSCFAECLRKGLHRLPEAAALGGSGRRAIDSVCRQRRRANGSRGARDSPTKVAHALTRPCCCHDTASRNSWSRCAALCLTAARGLALHTASLSTRLASGEPTSGDSTCVGLGSPIHSGTQSCSPQTTCRKRAASRWLRSCRALAC